MAMTRQHRPAASAGAASSSPQGPPASAFGFAGMPGPPAGTAYEPTIWYSIAPDGIVTVNIIRAEMGQHVGTALARILADELEADWAKVRIAHVDTDPNGA